MRPVLEFLLLHGYWVLFCSVMAEQMAVPIPAGPVLLAMGALAGLGRFSFISALLLGTLACLICDQIWYRLGNKSGTAILRLICKISLEPDSCVSSTKRTFSRWGAGSLLFSKFVPGLGAVSAPMAGLMRMPMLRFMAADLAGSLIWCGAYLTLGFLFRYQLEDLAESLGRFGGWLLAALVVAAAGYVGRKYYSRQRFLRGLRVSRISPEELMGMMSHGSEVSVVDLRHPMEIEYDAVRVPGAIMIGFEELEARKDEIPADQDVILYCSCPNEASSARAALTLMRYGAKRVRPLEGGLEAWRAKGFPVETVEVPRVLNQIETRP